LLEQIVANPNRKLSEFQFPDGAGDPSPRPFVPHSNCVTSPQSPELSSTVDRSNSGGPCCQKNSKPRLHTARKKSNSTLNSYCRSAGTRCTRIRNAEYRTSNYVSPLHFPCIFVSFKSVPWLRFSIPWASAPLGRKSHYTHALVSRFPEPCWTPCLGLSTGFFPSFVAAQACASKYIPSGHEHPDEIRFHTSISDIVREKRLPCTLPSHSTHPINA